MPTRPPLTSRLVLRDGSTAGVRPATASDCDAMDRFFDELSPASRRLRFLAATTASKELLNRFCENGEPQKALTLIVCRQVQEGMHIIGVGSYFAESETSAEVAFAVDDRFHGRGIATALLERLAVYGKDQNFEYFSASVLPENAEMLDVFGDSGFSVLHNRGRGCRSAPVAAVFAGEHRGGGRARSPGDNRIAPLDSEASSSGGARRITP